MAVQPQPPAPAPSTSTPPQPEIRVKGNRPRLLPLGEPPPATQATAPTATHLQPPGVAPAPYWTPDKSARFMAQGMKSLSKLYGPDMRLSEIEIDLLGPPAAAVMNDWMPLQAGEQGDKQANLIYLVAVVALLALFRLPDILEAHDMLPDWAARNRAKAERRAAAGSSPRPAAPAPASAPVYETPSTPSPKTPVPDTPGDRWARYEATHFGSGRLEPA
jgi:hypothetical protein